MAGGAVAAVHLSAVETFFGDFVPQCFAGHKLVSLNVEDTAVVLTNGCPRDQQPFVRFCKLVFAHGCVPANLRKWLQNKL